MCMCVYDRVCMPGILISAALFICSPTTAFAALMGSLVGNATALGLGGSSAAIASGLYGYNSSLTSACLFGMFFSPTSFTLWISILAAVFSTVITFFVEGLFAPFGLPAVTMSFCLTALSFNLMQGATPKMIPVPLDSMTVPEEHYERVSTIRRVFMVFAVILQNDNSSSLFERYMASKNRHLLKCHLPCPTSMFGCLKASTGGLKMKTFVRQPSIGGISRLEEKFKRATSLFNALGGDVDGILEPHAFKITLAAAGLDLPKTKFLLSVFEAMMPPRATGLKGLRLEDWCEYIDMLVSLSTLFDDIMVLLCYADFDGSGGLDADELQKTQESLNMDLISQDDLTRFVLACGAENADDDVTVDQIIQMVVMTFLRSRRSELSNLSNRGNSDRDLSEMYREMSMGRSVSLPDLNLEPADQLTNMENNEGTTRQIMGFVVLRDTTQC